MPDNEMRREEEQLRHTVLDAEELRSWYGGSSDAVSSEPADAERPTDKPPNRAAGCSDGNNKKRRRTKIFSLSVCAFVVLCAVFMWAWRLGGASVRREQASGGAFSQTPSDDSAADYGDYRDYFETYYTSSDAVNIARAETGAGASLVLTDRADGELSLQEIYAKVNPAVVGITTYVDGVSYSWGSGVVFTEDGYVITNTHILQGSDAAEVSFADGAVYDALLVGADSTSDIAVLKIDAEDLPCAEFGASDSLRVGDSVVAIGNPLGEDYSGTMTNGIISAIDRNVAYNGHVMTLLQTNAALNEGNSGGPLVNMYGQVIGITNMKIMSVYYSSVEGIGFAIPSAIVKDIADQLLESGVVSGEPTIGITAGSVSAEARAMYDLPDGVYVASVDENSDAYEKGLQVGDIILEVNGAAVTTVSEVNAIKDEYAVGDTLMLTVYRDGETFEMEIELIDGALLG